MGIRFYCPNGHRLNVKDFLAGKHGICPHCDARFRIPQESELPQGAPKIKPGSLAEDGLDGSQLRRAGGSGVRSSTMETTTTLVRAKTDEKLQVGVDPIEESPDAIWYVRPPSGGQYGPAKGDVVRRWITEGRVSADSLVWREGWSDWKMAGSLFPTLGGAHLAAAQQVEPAGHPSDAVLTEKPADSPALPTAKKSVPQKRSALFASLMVVLILALGAGLVLVLAMKS